MKTQHTPGPWIVDDRHIHPDSGRLTYPAGQEPETDVILLVDTDCHKNGLLTATDKANLRLAAAAPELLAALEQLFEHCAMTHSKWGEGCNREQADAAIAAGRAAIAKAVDQ